MEFAPQPEGEERSEAAVEEALVRSLFQEHSSSQTGHYFKKGK